MGCLDQGREEVLTERWAFCALRVPLDAPVKRAGGVVDGFDEAIIGSCGHREFTRSGDSLLVSGVDEPGSEPGTPVGRLDGVVGIPVTLGVRGGLG